MTAWERILAVKMGEPAGASDDTSHCLSAKLTVSEDYNILESSTMSLGPGTNTSVISRTNSAPCWTSLSSSPSSATLT